MTDNSELVKELRKAGEIERREWGSDSGPTLYDRAADEIERLQSFIDKVDHLTDLIIASLPPKDQSK